MPIFGFKEGTPSNGRPSMSAPAAPIRVHHNGGDRPAVPPSGGKAPSSTPLFVSMFGISRHKKQNSAPIQTNTTNLPSEYYMDESSNGLQGSYTNGYQKAGDYTSAFHPVGKPPVPVVSQSNNHNGLSSNNHNTNRRQSVGGEEKQSTSFFQRLTRRKMPVSMSTPSSPASTRRHFFSFGFSDSQNRPWLHSSRESQVRRVGKSVAAFSVRYRRELGIHAKVPKRDTILDWYTKFKGQGSVERKKRPNIKVSIQQTSSSRRRCAPTL